MFLQARIVTLIHTQHTEHEVSASNQHILHSKYALFGATHFYRFHRTQNFVLIEKKIVLCRHRIQF